jgi:hypothetical protein
MLLSDGLLERAILTDRTTTTDSPGSAPDTPWFAKVILCEVSKMALLSHIPSPNECRDRRRLRIAHYDRASSRIF